MTVAEISMIETRWARDPEKETLKILRDPANQLPEGLQGSLPSDSIDDDSIRVRLADAARHERKRCRLSAFLERDTPAWNPDDHPDIDAEGGAAAWVRKLRGETEQSFERRTGNRQQE